MVNRQVINPKSYIDRLGFVIVAVAIAFAGIMPALIFGYSNVAAAGPPYYQVTTRSITMSSSLAAATGVTYTVTFTPITSVTHPDMIIDFCSNDPLIGDACTATAGTDTPNFSSAAASGWTLSTIGSGRGVKLTTSSVSFTGSTPVTITITNVTNPSNATQAFYGRIITYPNGAAGAQTSVSPSGYDDYGGVALSNAQNITIVSKVFETLSFCVYSSSCGTAAALNLGNSSTDALSSTTAYVNSGANYQIATNASHGVTVAMTGQTLCDQTTLNYTNCPHGASLNTIAAIGTTPGISAVGTSQFGMCVYNGGNATLNVGTAYTDGTATKCNGITTGSYAGSSDFGFDDTNTTGTNSASGSTVMSDTTGPLALTTGNFTFLGNISSTTVAGIYNSNLNLVATGTF